MSGWGNEAFAIDFVLYRSKALNDPLVSLQTIVYIDLISLQLLIDIPVVVW